MLPKRVLFVYAAPAATLLALVVLLSAWSSGGAAAAIPPFSVAQANDTGIPTPPLAPASPCIPVWAIVSSPNTLATHNNLYSMAAISANDIWAVGAANNQPLILHWDGTQWSIVPGPQPAVAGSLNAIYAISTDDVWAVGSRASGSSTLTLAVHWDGTQWTAYFTPGPGATSNRLDGVSAVSSNDVWAVGYYGTSSGANRSVIEHWDGSQWSIVLSPSIGNYTYLSSVTAISTNDVWTAGHSNNAGRDYTLIEHWDGQSWSVVPTPNMGRSSTLRAIAAVSANDMWAAGDYLLSTVVLVQSLILHWDGIAWSVVASANGGSGDNHPAGLAAFSANDVWLVGAYDTNTAAPSTLTTQWDGAQWNLVSSPNVDGMPSYLTAVAIVSPSEVWAAGWDGTTAGSGNSRTLIERYSCPLPTPTGTPPTVTATPTAFPATPTPTSPVSPLCCFTMTATASAQCDLFRHSINFNYSMTNNCDQPLVVNGTLYLEGRTSTGNWGVLRQFADFNNYVVQPGYSFTYDTCYLCIISIIYVEARTRLHLVGECFAFDVISPLSVYGCYRGTITPTKPPQPMDVATLTPTGTGTSTPSLTTTATTTSTATRTQTRTPTGTPPTATPTPNCPLQWRVVTSVTSGAGENVLAAAAALSPDNVWAVGWYRRTDNRAVTMIQHWDGTQWAVLPSPNVSTISYENFLTGISAISPSDIWAAGYSVYLTGQSYNLTLHWDGAVWSIVPSANAGSGSNQLQDVATLAPNDVWAVGSYSPAQYHWRSLIEHWNGSAWSVVPDPGESLNTTLRSVSAISPNDIWAVGYTVEGNYADQLILHWNGTQWSSVPNPSGTFHYLTDVDAVAPDDVWAAGFTWTYSGTSGTQRALIEHWNGLQWSVVNGPITGDNSQLDTITAATVDDVWAIWRYAVGTGPYRTFAEHWNGVQWSIVPTDAIGDGDNKLMGADAAGGNHVWAVGSYQDSGQVRTLSEQYSDTCVDPTYTTTPVPTITITAVPPTGTPPIATNTTLTNTRTPTNTPTITKTPTITSTPTNTPTNSLTSTPPTNTSTHTPTYTRTNTPTVEGTPAPPTSTRTGTPTPTKTLTPTNTRTYTPTNTLTPAITVTGTPPTATNTSIPTNTPITTPTLCPITFTDVSPSEYFYTPVQYLFCRNVISGYGTEFRPYNNTSRGQLCKIVVLAEGWDINTSNGPHFTDVPAGSTFYEYVETAYNKGIIVGYLDGTFRPSNDVTRGQLCKIVVLAQYWPLYTPTTPTFSDVPISHTFYTYIETAYNHGIISGYIEGNLHTFRPNNPATRGQICKIVYQAIASTRPTTAPQLSGVIWRVPHPIPNPEPQKGWANYILDIHVSLLYWYSKKRFAVS